MRPSPGSIGPSELVPPESPGTPPDPSRSPKRMEGVRIYSWTKYTRWKTAFEVSIARHPTTLAALLPTRLSGFALVFLVIGLTTGGPGTLGGFIRLKPGDNPVRTRFFPPAGEEPKLVSSREKDLVGRIQLGWLWQVLTQQQFMAAP